MFSRSTTAGALVLALGLFAAACGSDDSEPTTATETTAMEDEAMADEAMEEEAMEEDAMAEARPVLDVSFDGLEPLGPDFEYEAWTIVGGEPVTGGIFDIAVDGSLEISSPQDALYGHDGAEAVVITIEPAVGDDPAPADTHVLAGDVAADGTFSLTIDHPAALGTDFATASGTYILGTPTNDPDGDENSGVWFLGVPGPTASVELPVLPAGWVYEGWAVINGQPVTTGRFLDPASADDFAGFSGPNQGPNYPGEDFIVNPPDGLEFPTDLAGMTVVISVEPDADNSPAPFALKPLLADVPVDASDHVNYELSAGPVAISGFGTIG